MYANNNMNLTNNTNNMNKSFNSKIGKNTFNNTMYSNKKEMNEYLEMDINRIREFIQVLEEHQLKCEKTKNFVDAEFAKQKVMQLKQVEKEKILSDMKIQHQEEINAHEIERNNAFYEFNSEWDNNYVELMEKFAEFEERLKMQQQEDLNAKVVEFDKKFTPVVKPTSEILNLSKILNGLIRQKDYIKAHQIQVQIDRLSENDSTAYALEKERRLQKEVEKIKQKHYQEYQVLAAKKELAEAEFSKNRQLEFDKLVQGFKNRQKEIEMHHSFEQMQITNPKKYLARNLNRNLSQPRLHSSSSVDRMRGGNKSNLSNKMN